MRIVDALAAALLFMSICAHEDAESGMGIIKRDNGARAVKAIVSRDSMAVVKIKHACVDIETEIDAVIAHDAVCPLARCGQKGTAFLPMLLNDSAASGCAARRFV